MPHSRSISSGDYGCESDIHTHTFLSVPSRWKFFWWNSRLWRRMNEMKKVKLRTLAVFTIKLFYKSRFHRELESCMGTEILVYTDNAVFHWKLMYIYGIEAETSIRWLKINPCVMASKQIGWIFKLWCYFILPHNGRTLTMNKPPDR